MPVDIHIEGRLLAGKKEIPLSLLTDMLSLQLTVSMNLNWWYWVNDLKPNRPLVCISISGLYAGLGQPVPQVKFQDLL